MKLNRPQPFEPKREYKPGERCTYKGMVLIAEVWTKWNQKFTLENPKLFPWRCARCQIKREDCPAVGLHCFKTDRSDRKTIYWRFLRFQQGYTGKRNLIFGAKGEITGIEITPEFINGESQKTKSDE